MYSKTFAVLENRYPKLAFETLPNINGQAV
jgi:hypothetical protein